ncbi:MAG: hypothetical protein AB1Z98_26345 [Nannocystaceae bacterium]
MRGPSTIAGLAALVLGAALGSCGGNAYTCSDDSGCAGLSDGVCEPDGFCSVPDDECNSGRRYAPASGELSDRCVPGADSTGTTHGDGDSDSTGLPSPDDVTGVDDAEATGQPTADDSTGGGFPVTCEGELVLFDDFDGDSVDRSRWAPYANGRSIDLGLWDGALWAAVDAPDEGVGAYAGIGRVAASPAVGEAGAELLVVPEAKLPGEVYVTLIGEQATYGFDVASEELATFEHTDDYSVRVVEPFDPQAHRWVRMAFDEQAGTLQWQVSPDGFDWTTIDSETELATGWSPSSTSLEIGGGLWTGPYAADPLFLVDNAFVCSRE